MPGECVTDYKPDTGDNSSVVDTDSEEGGFTVAEERERERKEKNEHFKLHTHTHASLSPHCSSNSLIK